mmetsp:Transcript_12412/g.19559  ORF Transcript_12412/g.19559 Transcript_12412/m.19559 type:complete len:152 (+) Transcript_12412:68-523(+)
MNPCWDPENIPFVSGAVAVPYLRMEAFLLQQPGYRHSMEAMDWTVFSESTLFIAFPAQPLIRVAPPGNGDVYVRMSARDSYWMDGGILAQDSEFVVIPADHRCRCGYEEQVCLISVSRRPKEIDEMDFHILAGLDRSQTVLLHIAILRIDY